jgi:hypothetical protein
MLRNSTDKNFLTEGVKKPDYPSNTNVRERMGVHNTMEDTRDYKNCAKAYRLEVSTLATANPLRTEQVHTAVMLYVHIGSLLRWKLG